MKKLRTAALLILFLALLALFAVGGSSPRSVHAQGGSWSHTWDLTGGTYPRTPSDISTVADAGYLGTFELGTGLYGASTQCVVTTGSGERCSELAWSTDHSMPNPDYGSIHTYVTGGTFHADSVSWTSAAQSGYGDIEVGYAASFGAGYTINSQSGADSGTLSINADVQDVAFVVHSSGGADVVIYTITIAGTGVDPWTVYDTPTPTFTASPTPTFGPPPGGGAILGACPLLGDRVARFIDLFRWDLSNDALAHPDGQTEGLLMPFGDASLFLSLDAHAEYAIHIKFHLTDPQAIPKDNQTFAYALGRQPFVDIPMDNTTDPQTYDSNPARYEPDIGTDNQYTLDLAVTLLDQDQGITVDMACVELIQKAPISNNSIITEDCSECVYQPKGGLDHIPEDAMELGRWLWCGIKKLFTCLLAVFLNGLWRGVITVITFLAFLRLWASIIIERGIPWILGIASVLWAWLRGGFNNFLQLGANIIVNLLNGLHIADILNTATNWAQAAINAVLDVIRGIINVVQVAFNAGAALFGIVFYWIGRIIDQVGGIIIAIPVLILAIINGFNAAPTAIPIYAPTCNSSNTLFFWPCLGGYIIDNTLLDGPLYLVLIVVVGVIALFVILWAIQHIREALST